MIVALIGWGQDGGRRQSHEAGIDHHLVKPVDPRVLRELLARPDRIGSARIGSARPGLTAAGGR